MTWREETGRPSTMQQQMPAWLAAESAEASGAVLARAGLQLPGLNPAQAMLLDLEEIR
ncbi:hypothetical protein [Nocardiopsis salina]|uniref:hypothetical protein n=1 Tax=Nocardiopsis salina TaxID=245836 RepID=UPI0003452D59